MRRKGMMAGLAALLAGGILFPEVMNEGAKEGLHLWFSVVLPALFPFMVCSGVLMKLGAARQIGKILSPLLHRLLGLSENGCYVMAVGWISGYPMGAGTAAQLYREREICKAEAEFLLTFCNNASPMFLLEYMGVYCMGMQKPWLLLGCVYGAAVANALLFFRKKGKSGYQTEKDMLQYSQTAPPAAMAALDGAILDSFVTVTKVGGYIILFSILAQFVETVLPCHPFAKLLGLGALEITTGGEYLRAWTAPAWAKWVLVCGISSFGGLSSAAQTYSVTQKTDLSMGKYLHAKILHAAAACVMAAVLWMIQKSAG